MPPSKGDVTPNFEAMLCDGEAFRAEMLEDMLAEKGAVLVFFGFIFNAISINWWKRYDRYGWADFDVPVYGVGSDGPYAMNEFLRQNDSPFELFADVNGDVAAAYDLSTKRDGMAGAKTAQRAIFVINGSREVRYQWDTDEWIHPIPHTEVERAVENL